MHSIERLVRQAWERVGPSILKDPHQLSRRRARLTGKHLSRPPRAWCLAELADAVPPGQSATLRHAAAAHRDAAWPHITEGDFAATHWLVSFALLSADRDD